MKNNPKQAIIVNMAVNMPIGRLIAQACHASLISILNKGKWNNDTFSLDTENNFPLKYWLKGDYTKIVFKEWGESRLEEIIKQAEELNIPYGKMIEEEKGESILTAIALGPIESSSLDRLTSGLTLL